MDLPKTSSTVLLSKLLSTSHRRIVAAAVVLLLLHTALLAYSATRHSPTLNEPGHLLAGLSYWEFGEFALYRVNPPLTKMIGAAPVVAVGYEAGWIRFQDAPPRARPIFPMSYNFVNMNQERSLWLMTIARWACIPISLAGALFCFLFSRELWNSNVAGFISLTLWCFEPMILAHGELMTPDCAAASFGLGATWLFWRWLRQPSWQRAIAAGVLLGLAELSKMTWIILFGIWPFLWIAYCLPTGHRRLPTFQACRQQTTQLIGILLTGLYLLNLGYGFEDTGTPLKDFRFCSSSLTGEEDFRQVGNRFTDTWLGKIPMPVPKQYLLGIDVQLHDFENYGQRSYLNGEWKDGGWWYYYLFGLAFKTTHGIQCLLLFAVLAICTQFFPRLRHRSRSGKTSTDRNVGLNNVDSFFPSTVNSRDLLILLTPGIAVLVLVSSQREFNHHVRYVLPVLGFAFVLAGVLGRVFKQRIRSNQIDKTVFTSRLAQFGVSVALSCTVVSSLSSYPHQLAYFNELSGGPQNGYRHLAHSNVDWGQDLLLVREWIQLNNIDHNDIQFMSYNSFPFAEIIGLERLPQRSASRIAIVSANLVTLEDEPWLNRMAAKTTQRIGYSLWVFHEGIP